MRKLIVTEFISVDGIAEVETGVIWNDEMNAFKRRRSLPTAAPCFWGARPMRFSPAPGLGKPETSPSGFNALPKYVASASLKVLDWKPAELLKGALPDAVKALKQGSGGNIHAWQPERCAGRRGLGGRWR